ncbi:MAG: hypothetical protein KAR24_03065 [Candidatus Pacebacteria bacterium]|nr:hypothetical protein [Candidatus Paceibacterota bacterium]MCK5592283.1 hypothetical protein [Candidatus Paceibacterota bacterium]
MRSINIKSLLNILFVSIAVLTIFGYAYFRTQAYLSGPQITIEHPLNSVTVYEPLLVISGTTERASSLHLNGRKIFIDDNNVFKEDLLLYPGYNIITIEATDRFDKHVKEHIEVIYQET